MSATATIHVIDDDQGIRTSLKVLFEANGFACETHESGERFLAAGIHHRPACVLLDVRMPGIDGFELLNELASVQDFPVIMITAFGDIPLAVRAMRGGASDFIEKPFVDRDLIEAVKGALARVRKPVDIGAAGAEARQRMQRLSPRERDVLELLVAGETNKTIGERLGISPRTVEIHRSNVMTKCEVGGLAELVRLAITGQA